MNFILFFKQTIRLTTIFFCLSAQGQQTNTKVKILLLGTIHFDPSKTDLNKNTYIDLKSATRLREIYGVINKITMGEKPTKLFVETTPGEQPQIDSAYNNYINNNYEFSPDIKDEIEHIGFRLAQYCKAKIVGVNYLQEMDFEGLIKKAQEDKQYNLIDSLLLRSKILTESINTLFRTRPLLQAFLELNSSRYMSENLGLYLKYNSPIGASGNEKLVINLSLIGISGT
jgi:hypothetical protein